MVNQNVIFHHSGELQLVLVDSTMRCGRSALSKVDHTTTSDGRGKDRFVNSRVYICILLQDDPTHSTYHISTLLAHNPLHIPRPSRDDRPRYCPPRHDLQNPSDQHQTLVRHLGCQ